MTCVKICGITNLEDALVATEAGADLLGFVFYDRSPRHVEPNRAGEIIAELRRRGSATRIVGVFVNESIERIRQVMEQAQLDLVQLHGNEQMNMVRDLSPRAFKALRPQDESEAVSLVEQFRAAIVARDRAPAFIVDAFDAVRYGGTGARADWSIAARIADEFPILLAGGLRVETVAESIHVVEPWGVDVSSGVERAPGLKDHAKVKAFIQRAKGKM